MARPSHRPEANRQRRRRPALVAALCGAALLLFLALDADIHLRLHAGSLEGIVLAQTSYRRYDHRGQQVVRHAHVTVIDPETGTAVARFPRVRSGALEAMMRAHRAQAKDAEPPVEEQLRLPGHRTAAYVRGRAHYAGLGRRVVYAFGR